MTTPASYAVRVENSKGRVHQEQTEPTNSGRNPFQRDRDRIIHCGAFRRLEYKTQVFLNHEGDHFRTRLTHSLEVAQIGRSVARRLNLQEDLVEAICLAHDLGHTPFGHIGQDALNDCMKDHSGFEHNLQSLWVVDFLEIRYPTFDGLNLTFETREGILKHLSNKNLHLHKTWLGPLTNRFEDGKQPSLEAQLANLADEIAYNNHDIEDGIRSGLLHMADFHQVAIWQEQLKKVQAIYSGLDERRLKHEVIRHMIHFLVNDLVSHSLEQLNHFQPRTIDEVRQMPQMIGFSPATKEQVIELKRFLFQNLYRHPQVVKVTMEAAEQVRFLFKHYTTFPHEIPAHFLSGQHYDPHRRVAHYIAGMTDRFAKKEFLRLNH
ncbi:deoxyguanosinetriphosphate triphosphohydrolase [Polynucleobacter kasalickyi]|uniref:Deoxyguanosinetriphosphate triphosphohydrolase-like protein n=1 Tax=Polynucleobacter kasalickyi TaxID=1938817 RepID=A0A1W2C0X6_9BURK|nr:deoxyguanosinetriphosphate triphosphohydrolase [Polynucleobacter kasalickyi]SMC78562.1 dGTPase [Polynucleobacter kasalickyi]